MTDGTHARAHTFTARDCERASVRVERIISPLVIDSDMDTDIWSEWSGSQINQLEYRPVTLEAGVYSFMPIITPISWQMML